MTIPHKEAILPLLDQLSPQARAFGSVNTVCTREGVSADQVIRQARQAADGYLKGNRAWNRRLKGFPLSLSGPVWGAAGAALASAIWCGVLLWL